MSWKVRLPFRFLASCVRFAFTYLSPTLRSITRRVRTRKPIRRIHTYSTHSFHSFELWKLKFVPSELAEMNRHWCCLFRHPSMGCVCTFFSRLDKTGSNRSVSLIGTLIPSAADCERRTAAEIPRRWLKIDYLSEESGDINLHFCACIFNGLLILNLPNTKVTVQREDFENSSPSRTLCEYVRIRSAYKGLNVLGQKINKL